MARNQLWVRFDALRTKETHGDTKVLRDNHVSLSIPGPCTLRDVVDGIARQSQVPIAIQSLADDLSQTTLPRGKVVFGLAGNAIDKIAVNYTDMRWWISKVGLNMAIVPPVEAKLSRFDDAAGKLYVDKSKDGGLPKDLLMAIAKKLDADGFSLKELQPAQRRPISEYNQRNPRSAIKTFAQACRHRVGVRSVRRRLYVARERCMKAIPSISPLPRMS
jgi:hypothetical protein